MATNPKLTWAQVANTKTVKKGPDFKPQLLPIVNVPNLLQPEQREVGNKFVAGRPSISHLDSRWPLPKNGNSKVPAPLPPQALENRTGVCYRNAIVQGLINTPIFVNWLMMHTNCSRRDCLACSLSKLARWYFNNNSQQQQQQHHQIALSTPLDEFWSLCKKVFWGPRAQKKKGVGPIDPEIGGVAFSFLAWLIRAVQDQCVNEPSDFQLLERMFTTQLHSFATCHNLNGPNGKCQFRSPEFYRHESEALVLFNNPGAAASTIEKVVEGRLRNHDYPKGPYSCPDCGSDAHLRKDLEIVNAPEILLLCIPRPIKDKTVFWNDIKLTENISMTNYTWDKSPLAYKLTSAGVYPGDRFGKDRGHIVSMVHARDAHWYRVDNLQVARLPNMQAIDDFQRAPTPENGRLMPHILFYTRVTDKDQQINKSGTKRKISRATRASSPQSPTKKLKRSPSPVGSAIDAVQNMSLRDISEMPTRQKVNDLVACFPDFSRAELHDMLIKHGGSIDQTVKAIQNDPEIQDMSLDDVPNSYRSKTIKAHLKFPWFRIQELYDAVRKNPFDFNKTIRELQSRPSINLGFTEQIADASFKTRLIIEPSDLIPTIDIRRLVGSLTYEIAGQTWEGSFKGQARLA